MLVVIADMYWHLPEVNVGAPVSPHVTEPAPAAHATLGTTAVPQTSINLVVMLALATAGRVIVLWAVEVTVSFEYAAVAVRLFSVTVAWTDSKNSPAGLTEDRTAALLSRHSVRLAV